MLASSETSLNIVGNDAIDKKHNTEGKAICLRREKGRSIENKRGIGFSMGSQDTDAGWLIQVQVKVGWFTSGGNVWKLSFDCLCG